MIKHSDTYFRFDQIEILSKSVLKIKDYRFVIRYIRDYSFNVTYVPNDITYTFLYINDFKFAFSEESEGLIKTLLLELDTLTAQKYNLDK